jgi:uncharacterized CHY-type Zn-finger protein
MSDTNSALKFDPFAGDDGDSRVLSDRIVTTRKEHKCHNCFQEFQAGQVSRHRVEVFDGELMEFRWCGECTHAMTLDGDEFQNREGKIHP